MYIVISVLINHVFDICEGSIYLNCDRIPSKEEFISTSNKTITILIYITYHLQNSIFDTLIKGMPNCFISSKHTNFRHTFPILETIYINLYRNSVVNKSEWARSNRCPIVRFILLFKKFKPNIGRVNRPNWRLLNRNIYCFLKYGNLSLSVKVMQ